MDSQTDAPSRQEKEAQLARILASQTFEKHPMLRALLARLVTDTVNEKTGGKDYEMVLAVDVFKKPKSWTTLEGNLVRQTMLNLRKRLVVYYGAEGGHDIVEISFPKRAGFAARFSYRPLSDDEDSVRHLAESFGSSFPDLRLCADIVKELEAIIRKHPSYAPAYAVLAEMILAGASLSENWDSAIHVFLLPQALVRAEEAIKVGMKLNGGLWRMHVAAGATHCCRFAWAKAEAAFNTALHLAPDDTRAHFCYMAFLLAVGRTEEAKNCARLRGRRPWRLAQYKVPLLSYVTRQDLGEAFGSLVEHGAISTNLDKHYHFDAWPGAILAACMCLTANDAGNGWICAKAGMTGSSVNAFWGLKALAATELTKLMADSDLFDFTRNGTAVQGPVSGALAFLGWGETGLAIASLEMACDAAHPLMVWLHLWPIFDPLRKNKRFKALIRKMNLP
jgi:hypothetical protein